jgi:hypothetical protein
MLQERIEELGSVIINLKNDKVYIDGFYNSEMLNKWLDGINCRMSMGMYAMEEYNVDYSQAQDYSLIIIRQNDNEITRYRYVPFFKGTVRYDNDGSTDLKSKTLSKVFKLRKCEYNNQYNLVFFTEIRNDRPEKMSLLFTNIDDIEKYFIQTFKNYKIYSSDNKMLKGGFIDVREHDID